MKRISLLLLINCILSVCFFSCAGIPKPQGESDSLVIGNLILDFPDGFFTDPKRTIKSGIQINMINLTKGRKFTLFTQNGYFHFSTNGFDKFVVESFSYEKKDMNGWYNLGRTSLDINIPNDVRKVIFLGNIKLTFAKPQWRDTKITDMSKYYHFDNYLDVSWDTMQAMSYLQETDSEGAWKDYTWENNIPEKTISK